MRGCAREFGIAQIDWRCKSMKRSVRFVLAAACGASSLFILGFGSFAFAADKGMPEGATRWLALDRCAAYGPDFTSVEGTKSCVKIGGHVRVGFGSRNYDGMLDQNWEQGGAAPAAMRTEGPANADETGYPAGHHLRLRPDAGPIYSGYLH